MDPISPHDSSPTLEHLHNKGDLRPTMTIRWYTLKVGNYSITCSRVGLEMSALLYVSPSPVSDASTILSGEGVG